MQAQDSKFKIYKQSVRIQLELLSKNQSVIITVFDKNDQNSLLFQDQFEFDTFKNESDLFLSTWSIFCQMIKYTFEQKLSNITLKAQGQLIISYEHHGLGQTFTKSITFKLKRRLEYQEEVRILRQKVNNYEQQMQLLQSEVQKLRLQNVEIFARLNLLEQINSNKKESQNVKIKQSQSLPEQPKTEEIQQTLQDSRTSIVQRLPFELDTQALYYCKYKIDGQRIISLNEDYYQVNWKNLLPKNGITTVSFKVCARNHYSIGIISESELKNQYSFQNKNSICLYTYFDGGFRGLYVKGEYIVLDEWPIQINEIVQMKLNLSAGKLEISIKGKSQAKEVNIKDLQKNGNIYFFVQMYEKDNVLQFISE